MFTDIQLKSKYDSLNNEFFSGKLPDITVRFGELPDCLARTHFSKTLSARKKLVPYKIVLSNRLRKMSLGKAIGMALLHEMVHVRVGFKPSCKAWDGAFDREMTRLAVAGAMKPYW